ncbi:MAG: helix-turn-helix transcriptional regulator [Candidatus Omnitrophica bacterium]|nr:helix-turn-helix transcriptional regulator [Candidatus Omnitrophota bacterium]
MKFGDLLKRLRQDRRMRQVDLARRARVSLKAVKSWEQHWRLPHMMTIPKLAKALGLPPEQLGLRLWSCRAGKRVAKLAADGRRTERPAG